MAQTPATSPGPLRRNRMPVPSGNQAGWLDACGFSVVVSCRFSAPSAAMRETSKPVVAPGLRIR